MAEKYYYQLYLQIVLRGADHIVSKENVQHFIFLYADGLINVLSAQEPKLYQQKQTY
ncbi:MAG: hypothetical protein LBF27_26035 [Sphingobacterium sp.]|jgi:sulfur relay (sulfurtransferase) complex TusBCD TusD component (DsrE family)|nr:hypothetical protein [Sphingobacterium sp.]